jgi:hypothetical protein
MCRGRDTNALRNRRDAQLAYVSDWLSKKWSRESWPCGPVIQMASQSTSGAPLVYEQTLKTNEIFCPEKC